MDLTHLNHSLYPRAINASVEGHLRQERGTTPNARRHSSPASPPAREPARRPRAAAQRYQEEQAAQWRHDQANPDYAGLPGFGEQMAVASRQARQTHVRHGHRAAAALVSARGREANRRYLDTPLSSQARFIDEVV